MDLPLPRVIELTLGARPIGPNEMAWTEAAGGEGALSFGVERILDGLDMLIARRADR